MTRLGFCCFDLQYDVLEFTRRCRMRNGLQDLEATVRQLPIEKFCEAGTECGILVHDHDGFCWLACLIVYAHKIVERRLGNYPEAGAKAEGIFQSARDNAVDDADVNDIRQVVSGRGLCRSKANRAGIAADHGTDAGLVHFFNFGIAAIGVD